jgi:hypothetical protein
MAQGGGSLMNKRVAADDELADAPFIFWTPPNAAAHGALKARTPTGGIPVQMAEPRTLKAGLCFGALGQPQFCLSLGIWVGGHGGAQARGGQGAAPLTLVEREAYGCSGPRLHPRYPRTEERPAGASGGMARWRDVLERLNVKLAILRQLGVGLQGQRRSTRSVYE